MIFRNQCKWAQRELAGAQFSGKNPSERQKRGALSEAPLAGSGLGAEALEDAWMGDLVPEPAADSCLLLPQAGELCFLSNQRIRDLELFCIRQELYTNSESFVMN